MNTCSIRNLFKILFPRAYTYLSTTAAAGNVFCSNPGPTNAPGQSRKMLLIAKWIEMPSQAPRLPSLSLSRSLLLSLSLSLYVSLRSLPSAALLLECLAFKFIHKPKSCLLVVGGSFRVRLRSPPSLPTTRSLVYLRSLSAAFHHWFFYVLFLLLLLLLWLLLYGLEFLVAVMGRSTCACSINKLLETRSQLQQL